MKLAIVTSFDENYIEYSKGMMKSLGLNYHGKEPLNVICLVPESMIHLAQQYSESIRQENLIIEFRTNSSTVSAIENANFSGTPYVTKHAYIRVFIGSIMYEYDTAIYIDPDTVILRDINPLISYKNKGPFSAVLETVNSGKRVFGNDDFPYFSSGVFIADLNFWRSEKIEEKILNWITNNPDSVYAEQDSLNAVLSEYMSPLPFSFNFFEWIVDNNLLMAQEYDNPLIVHFVGADKPWGEKVVSKYSLAWRKYYGLLA